MTLKKPWGARQDLGGRSLVLHQVTLLRALGTPTTLCCTATAAFFCHWTSEKTAACIVARWLISWPQLVNFIGWTNGWHHNATTIPLVLLTRKFAEDMLGKVPVRY